ncbi:2072_t:CDS:1, partial [Dentiscutata erythropus]
MVTENINESNLEVQQTPIEETLIVAPEQTKQNPTDAILETNYIIT